MKKNLFLLFSFYFFVLQSVFVGLLWGDAKFYWLALINCVFICLIAIFAKDSNQNSDDSGSSKTSYENTMKKNESMKISHFWIFLISFLFGLLVIFWLKDVVLYLRVLLSVVGGIFVFMVGGLLFNYKSLRVWEGKFYLVLLILSLMWSIIGLLNVDFFNRGITENLEIAEDYGITEDSGIVEENILIPEDEIIDNYNTGDILTGTDEANSEILGGLDEIFGKDIDLDALATFEDVIKYLLKDEKLSTKTDLSFSYIGKSNPDYAYYKTAYEKKMIGKDLQPTKNLMCETYVVMKGLVEEWNVGTYSDIKQAYWAYAKNNGLLPSCQYGKYVKIGDLN